MKQKEQKKKKNNTSSKSNKTSVKTPTIKKKPQKKSIINKNNYLYLIFIALSIIVIFLGIKVYQKSKVKKVEEANIVIPILKKEASYDMTIDLQELLKKGEYSIKISNFRQDNINKEEIEYKITITNESNASIKVTKDQDDTNLIIDQTSTRIEGVSLKANKKDYAIYHFSVDKNGTKIKSGNKINISVKS